jgi:hypothetical protein
MVPPARTRTCNIPLTRRALYPWSYSGTMWLRRWDLNPRPPAYEAGELPDCSTPRHMMKDANPCQQQLQQVG